jgi:hypothetical protein
MADAISRPGGYRCKPLLGKLQENLVNSAAFRAYNMIMLIGGGIVATNRLPQLELSD